jgi:hypothetical protein
VIVEEGVNKSNHPIQNPLLLVTEPQTRDNIYNYTYKHTYTHTYIHIYIHTYITHKSATYIFRSRFKPVEEWVLKHHKLGQVLEFPEGITKAT